MRPITDLLTIFEQCQKVEREIESDFGGGSPVSKTFVMSYLIQEQQLKSFVEVGVYKGRSLFPVAYSVFLNGGNSFGIDPYVLDDAKEKDVNKDLRKKIDLFLKSINFDNLYRGVLEYRETCGYGESIKLFRETSKTFFSKSFKDSYKFDIAHIDGNHDTIFVREDFENCRRTLIEGGFIVFDDIDWASVKVVYEEAKETCPVVFECEQFGILIKEAKSISRDIKIEKLSKKLNEVYGRVEKICLITEGYIPTVAVGVLVYNQVDYIKECLDSVFTQVGDFRLNVVICDDSSNDGTSELIYDYISKRPEDERIKVAYFRNETNLGVIGNLQKLISLLSDSDYFTFCEGDDYYLSSTRLSQHIKLQEKHPEFSMTYNRLLIYDQDNSKYEIFEPCYTKEILPSEELAKDNIIGNLNCVFYSSSLIQYIKPDMFEMFAGDWMLALYLSQFGTVGLLNKPLNVYRRHGGGIWSSKDDDEKCEVLIGEIDKYNEYLNFTYDKYLSLFRRRLLLGISDNRKQQKTISIIDDVSLHPISGFRYEEFTSILKNIQGSELLTTGGGVYVLGTDKIDDLIIGYKREYPDLATSVEVLLPDTKLNTKLLYCDFLGNAYGNMAHRAESEKIPFIFTLYPGGLFALNNDKSDSMLARVMNSPYFKKVIVTQRITKNYLIEKNFCSPDKIEYIRGVVAPGHRLDMKIAKKHYGIDKKMLDICFVAHKYSEFGEDKGYDVFLDVARKLSRESDNIRFHVVGPWDKNIISTKDIKNLKYYGTQCQDWFDRFYKDKDIILSPNTNGKIIEGSLDEFPTGAATDAALRKVAMFVTDPLNLNDNNFADGKEIVIIKHDVDDIIEKVKYYINNPMELRDICENGNKKTNLLYSFERQMKPRLNLLKKAIAEPFELNIPKETPEVVTLRRQVLLFGKRCTPPVIRKSRHKLKRIWQKIKTA